MAEIEYVTVWIGGQLFGAPVSDVQDVFLPTGLTRVPGAPAEVGGLLNLRGRVVTAIDARARLGLAPHAQGTTGVMAVGIEKDGEAFGLLVDKVGEVLRLDEKTFESNPVTLDPRWAAVSRGVHRLDGRLLVIMDITRMLAFDAPAQAA
jgi:purine-binding chemotaxis protein CheW